VRGIAQKPGKLLKTTGWQWKAGGTAQKLRELRQNDRKLQKMDSLQKQNF